MATNATRTEWNDEVTQTFDHLLELFERLSDEQLFWYDRLVDFYGAFTGEQGIAGMAPLGSQQVYTNATASLLCDCPKCGKPTSLMLVSADMPYRAVTSCKCKVPIVVDVRRDMSLRRKGK